MERDLEFSDLLVVGMTTCLMRFCVADKTNPNMKEGGGKSERSSKNSENERPIVTDLRRPRLFVPLDAIKRSQDLSCRSTGVDRIIRSTKCAGKKRSSIEFTQDIEVQRVS